MKKKIVNTDFNEKKPQRMRVTLEANVIVKDDSVSFYPGGQKILNVEPIHSSLEDVQVE